MLAIQEENDEYASLEAICGFYRRVFSAQLLALSGSVQPLHRDQTTTVSKAVKTFIGDRLQTQGLQ